MLLSNLWQFGGSTKLWLLYRRGTIVFLTFMELLLNETCYFMVHTSIIKTWLCNFWYINQVADFSNRFWPIYPMCEVIANLFFGKNFSDIQCIKTKLNLLCVAFEVQNMYASFWKIHLKFRPQTSKTNYASDMVIRF